jgi:hypothetical protein
MNPNSKANGRSLSRQAGRDAWSQPTLAIVAARRALARLRYNLNRKRQAQRRLRELEDLLREFGYDPHGSLIGAGSAPLVRAYRLRFGLSRRQLFRDLAVLRVRNWQEYAPTPTATATATAMTAAAPPSLTPFARRHPSRPNQSAAPADSAPGAPAVSASTDPLPRLLAVLRREPCPTCGRLPGLPARTEHPSPWATAYAALRLTLEQQLEAGVVEALLVHAARLQAHLRPPRRLGDLPPRPPAQAHAPAQAQARPRLTRPSPSSSSSSAYAYDPPVLDVGPEPDLDLGPDAEVYIWRV